LRSPVTSTVTSTVTSRAASARKSYVLPPELATELMAMLDRLERLLVRIAIWEDLDDLVLPPPLAAGQALAATRRLWDTLAAWRGEAGAVVDVDNADLRTIAAALAQLRYAASRPAAGRDAFSAALAHVTHETPTADASRASNVVGIAAEGARLLAHLAEQDPDQDQDRQDPHDVDLERQPTAAS
jgi:hypothetical protein